MRTESEVERYCIVRRGGRPRTRDWAGDVGEAGGDKGPTKPDQLNGDEAGV